MSTPASLLPMNVERDKPAVARMLMLAFASPMDGIEKWMAAAGNENFRVLREGERGVATLLRIPMGQFFGGKSVPMLGIAGVAVPPEERGQGNAKRMMREAMLEAAREGWALSGLYASTHSLYRAVGFERAGYRFQFTVPNVRIDVDNRDGRIVPLNDNDMPRVEACYKAFARRFDGMLDRGKYIWDRIRTFRGEAYTGFGVEDGAGALSGYVFLNQSRHADDGRQSVTLTDFVFLAPAVGRRLWGLLRDFEMMSHTVTFFGGPNHPAITLLQQERHKMEIRDTWLIRVTDVGKALEQRGYAPCVRAQVHLDVRDELIESNNGRFILDVADGAGKVSRGGDGHVRVSARGLATIYSGFYTPAQALLQGHCEGDEQALSAAAGVFASGTPWMVDMF